MMVATVTGRHGGPGIRVRLRVGRRLLQTRSATVSAQSRFWAVGLGCGLEGLATRTQQRRSQFKFPAAGLRKNV
jgi:hypothetical protein